MNTYLCELHKSTENMVIKERYYHQHSVVSKVEGNKKRRNGIDEGYNGI